LQVTDRNYTKNKLGHAPQSTRKGIVFHREEMSMSLLRIIATFAERPPDVNEEQHLKLVETALQMFGTSGGFACLIAHAEAQGFEGTVNSWQVGSYQPIKADEVSTLIGQDRLERMANQSGLSVASTSQDLRGILPLLVDKLSLRGQMPKGE
jgi:uncharacterized protein YidB (DUF937 family)